MENEQDEIVRETKEDTTKDRYLTFEIDNEEYGVDISNVIEIITMSAITWVPETPDFLKGVINLRGSIVPVIDARLRFKKPEKEYDSLTCIIVVEYENYTVGVIVDTVNEVMFIPEDKISLPPNAKLKYQNKFIKSIGKVGKDVQLLLDVDKFLFLD
ncbi:MAG: purine-binding chemotaxis protein CheW [Clostridiales bacterium]|nr:purine-binding chemotaxis protein CheW [Clostridiales bacterium]